MDSHHYRDWSRRPQNDKSDLSKAGYRKKWSYYEPILECYTLNIQRKTFQSIYFLKNIPISASALFSIANLAQGNALYVIL